MTAARVVSFGDERIRVEDVADIALRRARAELSGDPEIVRRMVQSAELLSRERHGGERVYGVTTGFGDSCDNDIDTDYQNILARNLVRFHGCGTGELLGEAETRAVMVARLASLARGYSAVRRDVVEALARLINSSVVPCIPSLGSVGASGDLTPLSYVAATLLGESRVTFEGRLLDAAAALPRAGLQPIALLPKESLALMNGTSMMTGLAALGFVRARRLGRLAAALTAMAVEALRGQREHFHDRIFELKPHPGQRAFARWVREDLGDEPILRGDGARLQDRYSIRCAPHVVGVLLDVCPSCRAMLEAEITSVNDNPIVDPEGGHVLHNGNFYGGHVGHVADTLKTCVANVADLLDRQLLLLLSPNTNDGLPRDLVRGGGREATANHGFKAVQIAASALSAEALKLTMPSSAFSRSTENHNQDKVSMGSIGARELLRILDLSETVAIMHLLALVQALELRGGPRHGSRGEALCASVRSIVPPLDRDRPMDGDIDAVMAELRADRLPIPEADFG